MDLPLGIYGVPTLRTRFVFDVAGASVPTGRHEITLDDANWADRNGWHEILVADVPGVAYEGPPQFRTDVTQELTLFPREIYYSPPRTMHAAFTVTLPDGVESAPDPTNGGLLSLARGAALPIPPPATAELPGETGMAGLRTGDLVRQSQGGFVFVLAALALSAGFGALHALEPGHGKSLVAAYFIGTRGSVPEALALGGIVATAHTAGVLLVGAGVLLGANLIVPERLFPTLQLFSGVVVVGLGLIVARDMWRGQAVGLAWLHGPPHAHAHDHASLEPDHHHDAALLEPAHHHRGVDHLHDEAVGASRPISRLRLGMLGLADGLVPTGSTVVMLLTAISLGRVPTGVALIAAFGAGFGAVVGGVALTFVLGARALGRIGARGRRLMSPLATAQRRLPALAVCVFVASGLVLVARGALALHL